MRQQGKRALSAVVVVALLALAAGTFPDSTEPPPVDPAEVRGAANFFFCALGQTVKFLGLFSGNLPLTVAGAIGGGLACGLGW
jgi:hypothetical protein